MNSLRNVVLWGAAGAMALGVALWQSPAAAQDYEIWALDQGTHMLHIYNPDLEELERVDLGAEGVRVPHMIDFTSDGAYAFIASTGSGDITIVNAQTREIVERFESGPRTHASTVKPDDSAVIAAVIGSADEHRDGKLVEIVINGDGTFERGRELVIAEDPLFTESEDRFNDVAAICHEYSPDGRHAYVTLGPGLNDGGLVILDTESFELSHVFPPDVLSVNCGTAPTVDGRYMFVNGGGPETGVWYVIDMETQEIVHEDDSRGYDAHGVWAVPDGSEIWMVNRVTDNVIIIDPETFEIIEEIEEGFGETPDIIAMSPDSSRAYISLRGPNPVSAPHVAVGSTPGFAVVDIAARELIELVQPNPDDEASDFHGIGVRLIGQ
jgi:DNA-binding beta-propeller fold protein YncE